MGKNIDMNSGAHIGFSPHRDFIIPVGRHLWSIFSACANRRKSRLHLGRLSPHHLRDIGLTDAEAKREVAKRFWQR